MWILSTFILSFRCYCNCNESKVAWIGRQILHYIMMCIKHSSELNTVKIPSPQFWSRMLLYQLSNPPQVSFAASGSAKNDNNPMQQQGWLLKIMLPSCPTFNLLKSSVWSSLGNYCFSIDKLWATFLVSCPHILTIQLLMTYCIQKQRRKTGDILLHEWC